MTTDTTSAPKQPLHKKLGGYDFYRSIGSPKYVVAPMVDQSELAWRLLSKSPLPPHLAGPSTSVAGTKPDGTPTSYVRHQGGAHLAYTPMIHAKVFLQSKGESRGGDPQFNLLCGEEGSDDALAGIEGGDRPLFVQVSSEFCANDPDALLAAAKKIEDRCDAVDINFGCPQGIARKGHYGSFLQDEWELIGKLINTLHVNLKVPVTAKFRIFPDVKKTVEYAKMMEAAGAQILTCHGRTREMKGQMTGLADWEQIKAVKAAVKVPVFANGNILYGDDVERCLTVTGADGVMSAEGNLSNPAVFADPSHPHAYPSAIVVARRYLDIVDGLKTRTAGSAVKAHMFRLLKPILDLHEDLRVLLSKTGVDANGGAGPFRVTLEAIAERIGETDHSTPAPPLCPKTGYRDLPHWVAQPYIRSRVGAKVDNNPEFIDYECGSSATVPADACSALGAKGPQLGLEPCVDDKCSGMAATRCPTRACLIHCRIRRAVAGGMDAADAAKQAAAGGLVGQGCEAHEEKAMARQKRRQEKRETRIEHKRQKRQRKKGSKHERSASVEGETVVEETATPEAAPAPAVAA